MRNNMTTATRPLTASEHSGILAAKFLSVAYVGENVAAINAVPVPSLPKGTGFPLLRT